MMMQRSNGPTNTHGFNSLYIATLLVLSIPVSWAWQTPTLHYQPWTSTTSMINFAKGSKQCVSHLCASSSEDDDDMGTNTATATVEKYGLEAGLFESLTSKKEGGAETAKDLLKKYGVAYLATSIPLAAISFTICYFLVSAGVDVSGLLEKVGIVPQETTTQAGTAAIAYAAHKAASPIRFPPTVLLTPYVAKLLGKEPNTD